MLFVLYRFIASCYNSVENVSCSDFSHHILNLLLGLSVNIRQNFERYLLAFEIITTSNSVFTNVWAKLVIWKL